MLWLQLCKNYIVYMDKDLMKRKHYTSCISKMVYKWFYNWLNIGIYILKYKIKSYIKRDMKYLSA